MTRITEAPDEKKITEINNEEKKGILSKLTTELVFFIAINVLAVGVSTYQTYIGYKTDVAGNSIIALAIALMSGILFLAMNFEIRKKRLKGEKHSLHVVMYIIPLGISFFGNFNAFYANQTSKGFVKDEVTAYKAQLTQTHDEAIFALNNSVNINEFERDYLSALNQLEVEFNQPPVGWGKNAELRWGDLVDLLNSNGGSISKSVIAGTSGETRYNRAKSFANLEFNNIVSTKQIQIEPTVDKINEEFSKVLAQIDSLTNLPTPIYNDNMLSDMVVVDNNIRSLTSSALNDTEMFTEQRLKQSAESNVGTIKHTLQKAFVEREEPSATFFSLFFSLIIDLAGLLYIMVFIPFKRDKKTYPEIGRISGKV